MKQSCVSNFRLANRVCQVLLYARLPGSQVEPSSEAQILPPQDHDLALKTFLLSEDASSLELEPNSTAMRSQSDELDDPNKRLMYDLLQFVCLNLPSNIADTASKK